MIICADLLCLHIHEYNMQQLHCCSFGHFSVILHSVLDAYIFQCHVSILLCMCNCLAIQVPPVDSGVCCRKSDISWVWKSERVCASSCMLHSIGLPDLVFDAKEVFGCRYFSEVIYMYELLYVKCVSCITNRSHESGCKPDHLPTSQPAKNVSNSVYIFPQILCAHMSV